MKTLIRRYHTHPFVADFVITLILVVALKLSSGQLMWAALLDKDYFATITGLIMSLGFLAYVSMVYSINTLKMKRLRNSPQFKKVVLIMLLYLLLIIGLYFFQKLINNLGLIALAFAFTAFIRIVTYYLKTIILI